MTDISHNDALRQRIYASYRSAHGDLDGSPAIELISRAPYLHAVVARHFPEPRDSEILDLGCGAGLLLHVANERGYTRTVGVDVSPEQIAAAVRMGVKNVHEADLLDTIQRLPDESKDVVVCFDVIEHFNSVELLQFIDEVRRILRSSGRWIIHTINAESPFFGRVRYGDLSHEQAFTAASIRQLLRASGFSRVDCFEDRPVVHGAASLVRRVAWTAVRSLLRGYLAIETGSLGSGLILSQNFLTVARKQRE